MKRGACDGQSAYVAHRIDGAVLATLRDYLAKIKSTPKDIALEKRYKSEIAEYKRKQTNLEKEVEKLKRQIVELSAEIGSLFWERVDLLRICCQLLLITQTICSIKRKLN